MFGANFRRLAVASNSYAPVSIVSKASLRPVSGLLVSKNYSTVDESKDYAKSELYPKADTFVQSNTEPSSISQRPSPINVELTHVAPIKHEVKYGDKVAQITLASFTTKDLDIFGDFALRIAFYLGIPARGPIPLPRKTKRWTVIKSPFAMAKTKENFERITYRRQIRLYDANPETVQVMLSALNKYSVAGVGVKANLYSQESIDMVESMNVPSQVETENPLAVNKVDLRAAEGSVAQAVMELLKDPSFDAKEVENNEEEFKLQEAVDAKEKPTKTKSEKSKKPKSKKD